MDDTLYTNIIERLAKIEVKIDDVKSLQKKVNEHDNILGILQEKDKQQQIQINELYQKDKDKVKWIMGIVASIIITIGSTIIKSYL